MAPKAGIGAAGQSYATAVGSAAKANALSSSAFGYHSSASGPSSLALGRDASATQTGSVAIGLGSIANVANTVSVGSSANRRRIVNVAAGVGPNDAVNLAQLQAAVAAARFAPLSVAPAGATDTELVGDVRRELAELRTLVRQQQQRISELESRSVAAVLPPR